MMQAGMDFLEVIKERRSVREFTAEPVSDEEVRKILEAGRWAPSGKNTQPWGFVLVKSREKREGLARLSRQGDLIRSVPVCIAVIYDRSRGYDRDKDMQGIGACAENMLLAAHALGLGACWIGGITSARAEAAQVLGLREDEEIALLLVIGHPAPGGGRTRERRPLSELVREV